MLAFSKYANADAAVIKVLKYLSIDVDQAQITAEFDKHPHYPSLLAVSDVLTNFRIANAAYNISPDELIEIDLPFIAFTHLNGGDFLIVKKIDKHNAFVSSEKWENHQLSRDEFNKIYNSIILIIDGTQARATQRGAFLKKTFRKLKIWPFVLFALLVFFLSLFYTGYLETVTWQIILLTLIKTIGLATSILLLIQSIDSTNPLVRTICEIGGKGNCSGILSSKAANVFKGLSWSEVGFFYFAGTWSMVIFGGNSAFSLQLLSILNLLCLPYTIYSVYYQGQVAKQWCILCCIIQSLLWVEFGLYVTAFKIVLPSGTWIASGHLVICFSIPFFLWLLSKPLFLKAQQLSSLKQQFKKIKYDANLFNAMLTAQTRYDQPDAEWCIVLGNMMANNVVTIISNPYCDPCAATHNQLNELLNKRPDLQFRILFTALNTDNDIKTPVARRLLALNEIRDKTVVKQALDDWYGQMPKDYKKWKEIYQVRVTDANIYQLERQKSWCQRAQITNTPTLLVNGYTLPEFYNLSDLRYML